jgi:hypothetical protein
MVMVVSALAGGFVVDVDEVAQGCADAVRWW